MLALVKVVKSKQEPVKTCILAKSQNSSFYPVLFHAKYTVAQKSGEMQRVKGIIDAINHP